jgi:hypothetical protein
MAPESDSDRDAKLAELSRWHTEWVEKHEPTTPFKPEENTEYSDYNLHYVDVEASAEAEDEYMMRAREIMGLDPVTGLPVDRKE